MAMQLNITYPSVALSAFIIRYCWCLSFTCASGFLLPFLDTCSPEAWPLPQENCCWPAGAGKGWAVTHKKILKTLKVMEGYVLFSNIAMGITQMLCLKYEGKIQVSDFRYLNLPARWCPKPVWWDISEGIYPVL